MLQIGDRVYHKGAQGNGIIRFIAEDKNRDKYGVQFFWEKYKEQELHDLDGKLPSPMGRWCSEESLVLMNPPTGNNYVTMIGGRSLDKLIRKVCEIPRRQVRDGSNVVINYGKPSHKVSNKVLMLNRTLIQNKYQQIVAMRNAGVSVPDTYPRTYEDAWSYPERYMIKPFISMCGYNMRRLPEYQRMVPRTHYIQRIVPKVREFRAHVFLWLDNPVPLIQEKVVDDTTQLCWNKHQGGVFRYPYQPMIGREKLLREEGNLVNSIISEACRGCRSIRYDFGGVDLVLDSDNRVYILEVNARMGVREQSLAAYKMAFNTLKTTNLALYKQRRFTIE